MALNLAPSCLQMVLYHVEVVAQQLEDDDGLVLLFEAVFLLLALRDHKRQAICGSAR